MSRKQLAAALLIGGVVLCIPGVIVAGLFAADVAEVSALRSASTCNTPTRDSASTCVSFVNGIATTWEFHAKSLDRVTIAFGDTTADVGYACELSPAGACDGISYREGTPMATAWWKGQIVAIGPAESRPAVLTDESPEYRVRQIVFFLIFAIPGIALVIAGLLVLQAPMSVRDLIQTSLARWPQPPRPVDRATAWRVALGYWTWGAFIAWFASYFFCSLFLMIADRYELAPWLFVTTLVLSFAITALIALPLLAHLVRTSARRTVTVRHTKEVPVKGGINTRVSYDLLDGTAATTTLGTNWHGYVQPGDRLDVLADPVSGRIRRVLSDPLELGVRREAPSGSGLDEAAVAQPQ